MNKAVVNKQIIRNERIKLSAKELQMIIAKKPPFQQYQFM